MSVFFGAYALERGAEIPAAWPAWVRQNISRKGHGRIQEFAAPGFVLIKLDVGAFSTPAWNDSVPGAVAMVAGDPVLPDRGHASTRARDLAVLEGAGSQLNDVLRAARGNYVFVQYRHADRSLTAVTDRMGARPLYWGRIGNCIVFAGAKRLIAGLPGANVAADVQGLVEATCLGVPLDERTELSGIRMIQGGRLARVVEGRESAETYWDWPLEAPAPVPDETAEVRRTLYDTFVEAAALRLGGDRAAFAALSGGLDSRTSVGALIALGIRVYSLNVSWAGSLDQILARRFAEAIGTRHLETLLPDGEDGRDILPRCWQMMSDHAEEMVGAGGQPRQYWGGNDGSISVGYVYISRPTVAALRRDDVAAAGRNFCAEMGLVLSRRALKGLAADFPPDYPARAVARELGKIRFSEPGHRLYLFLLMNHQRRMLAPHIEEVDLYPCEQVEPYFDAEFLRVACALPIEPCFGHGLYHRWLAEFPPPVAAIPWQTYPGHEPCPIPMPPEASSQWQIVSERVSPLARAALLDDVGRTLRDWDCVDPVLSRARLAAMYLGHRTRVLDATTSLRQALRIRDVLRMTGGRLAS